MSAADMAQGSAQAAQAQEPMVPQSKVNEIVSGARLDGESRARQQLEQQANQIAELQQQIAGIQGGGQQSQNTGNAGNGAPQGGQDMSELVKQELVNQQKEALRAEQLRQRSSRGL